MMNVWRGPGLSLFHRRPVTSYNVEQIDKLYARESGFYLHVLDFVEDDKCS